MSYKIINKHSFYYEQLGEGNTLLFIHGLGSSSLDWENQLAYFSKTNKVLSIDLRGHGKTKGSKTEYSIKGFAADIAGFLKEEKQPVTIVGISMGGMIAFELAVNYPKYIKSLVIINSFAEIIVDSREKRNTLRLRKIVPRILGMKTMGKIIAKKVFPYENQVELKKLVIERWKKNKVKDYVKSVNALVGWSIKNELHRIVCPVLVIGAEFDYISNDEKIAYTKLMPNARFKMIKNTHHGVSMENPKALNKLIEDFIN